MINERTLKDTSAKWLDSIPENWNEVKVKFISERILTGSTPPTAERKYYDRGTINWFTPGDFKENLILSKSSKRISHHAIEDGKSKIFKSNSVLIIGIGATLGKVRYLSIQGSSNQQINCIELNENKCFPMFIFYYFHSIEIVIKAFSNASTMGILNQSKTKEFYCPLPPLSEQRQIAAYLDYKTDQIDRFITNRKKQIVVLEEKIESVINNSVSHGYEELIKEVWKGNLVQPQEGWILEKMKYALSHIFLGLASTVDYVESADKGYPFVRATDFSSGELSFEKIKCISIEQHKRITKNRRAEYQDILFSKSGYIGNVAIVNVKFEFSIYESVFVLRPFKSKLNYKFLYYLLQAGYFKTQYIRNTVGMGVEHLNLGDVKETYILYPSLKEQQSIVDFLDEEIKSTRKLILKHQKQIDLMQEYKMSLINKAVTGKVDVRKWQPKQKEKATA